MDSDKRFQKWENKGEVLVFLHYFGGSARSWQWTAEELSKDYRCIAINLPGFGGAAAMNEPSIEGFAQYVQEVLSSLDISSYTLIGHSMGGKIAMQIASTAPDGAVEQLILIAPSPPTTEPMAEKEKNRMLKHPNKKVAEETVEGAIKKKLQEDKFRLAVNTQLIIDHKTWKWWLLEGMNHSIADRIDLSHLPIIVLASKDDPVITPEIINERVLQVFPHSKLINTEGIGHLIPLEAEDWLVNQIKDLKEKN